MLVSTANAIRINLALQTLRQKDSEAFSSSFEVLCLLHHSRTLFVTAYLYLSKRKKKKDSKNALSINCSLGDLKIRSVL